jgi:aerobic carbon-monoxide dehydrogenase medium subunit
VKPAPFEYHRATSVEETVKLLSEYEGMARVLAGGQSLVPMLHMRLMRPALIIDINRVPGLDRIAAAGADTRIGALVRYSSLERSPVIGERLPLMMSATRRIGDRQVRNRGTIGGSLSQADPTGEMPLVSLALSATVHAASIRGVREIPIEAFLVGSYETSLALDEIVTEVTFPPAPQVCTLSEVVRKHNDFAVLGVAVTATPLDGGCWSGVRVALSGVDENAVIVARAGELLEGTELSEAAIAAAADACQEVIDPPDDVRASADYRRHLVGVHVARALRQIRAERGPWHG